MYKNLDIYDNSIDKNNGLIENIGQIIQNFKSNRLA